MRGPFTVLTTCFDRPSPRGVMGCGPSVKSVDDRDKEKRSLWVLLSPSIPLPCVTEKYSPFNFPPLPYLLVTFKLTEKDSMRLQFCMKVWKRKVFCTFVTKEDLTIFVLYPFPFPPWNGYTHSNGGCRGGGGQSGQNKEDTPTISPSLPLSWKTLLSRSQDKRWQMKKVEQGSLNPSPFSLLPSRTIWEDTFSSRS